MARYGSAFDDETRTRKAEGIGTPIPPGTFPGDAANEPGPDNVIDHWFEPKRNFEPRLFPDKAPANDMPDAPVSRAFPEQMIGERVEPLGGVPDNIAESDTAAAGGFRARPEFPQWENADHFDNTPGLRGGVQPEAAGVVAALPAIAATVQQQYQDTYTPPPASWEAGVAGAEGSDPWQDPGTQGAETSPPDNSVTPGDFTDYGGQQLPGADAGGSAFDSGGGNAQDYSGGWFDSGGYGDFGGGGGGGGGVDFFYEMN